MVYTHALVTRPRPQLDELAGWLESAHLKPVAMPAFDFEATDEPIAPDAAWRGAGQRLLVFTSPRAVHYGLPALAGPMLWGSRVASIGPATTRALNESGIECLQAPGPDFVSEALLALLAEELPLGQEDGPESGAAVILTAPGGREALSEGLARQGWDVRVAPVYRRRLLDPESDALAAVEGAERLLSIWTSGVALEHLLAAFSDKALRKVRAGTAIVVSERLAALAEEQGIGQVRVSEGPSNGDILKCFHLLDV